MLKKRSKLTRRQLEVMRVLWIADEPLTASEILKRDLELNINTVQSVVKTLLEKEFIKVADIVYSGTVLCRSYIPLMTEQYYKEMMDLQQFDLSALYRVIKTYIRYESDLEFLEWFEPLVKKRKEELFAQQAEGGEELGQ